MFAVVVMNDRRLRSVHMRECVLCFKILHGANCGRDFLLRTLHSLCEESFVPINVSNICHSNVVGSGVETSASFKLYINTFRIKKLKRVAYFNFYLAA